MFSVAFVVGPTSVGKSRFALNFAERIGAEIVNADAFQVYDGLDLLTAKPSLEDRRRVPHHLFGTVPLAEPFNVARYVQEAKECLQDICRRNRPALVVGGTGLYVKALTHGLSPLPAPDLTLRARLEGKNLDDLVRDLGMRDPAAMTQVDLKNKRRVVRAVEVCETTGQPFSSYRDSWKESIYGTGGAGVFLDRARDDLRVRIDQQVNKMFDAGVIEEIASLAPATIGVTADGAIGLSEIRAVLAGEISSAECRELVKIRTRQYAKRQVTWFKREQVSAMFAFRLEAARIWRI